MTNLQQVCDAGRLQMERLISVYFLQELVKTIDGRNKGRQGSLKKAQATKSVPAEYPVV